MNIEPLFDLIQKMSPSEKRYFKLYFDRQKNSGSREYLDLFRIIEKQLQYEEAKVVAAIKNPRFAKNISSGKNYLYQLILKSLRAYHSDRRALFQVYGLIQDFHILMDKTLVEQAARRLQKAKKLAKKYHLTLPYLELLFLDRRIILSYGQKQSVKLLATNQSETASTLQRASAEVELYNLYDKTFLAIRNKMHLDDPEDSINALLKEFSAKVSVHNFSFDSRMTYHLIWANYYLVLKDEFENALLHMKNILDLFEEHPHLSNEYPHRYINVVNNYLNIYSHKKDFSPFPYYISRLQSIKAHSEMLRIKCFETINSLQLMQWLGQQQYEAAIPHLPKLIEGLKTYDKKIQKVFQLVFFQNIALIYFHTTQYDSALDWINKVVQQSKQDIRQDIQRFCRLLEVIIHFDLGNMEYMESLARSILRLSIDTPDDEVYKEVVRALVKASSVEVAERGRVLERLRLAQGAGLRRAMWGEEVLGWLERKH